MIKIGVFMGGNSLEREVSFNSGRTICDYLNKDKYHVTPLFIDSKKKLYKLPWQFIYRGKISDFEERLYNTQELSWHEIKNYIDFAYIAIHGSLGEDGTLQGFFDILDIPYVGSGIQTHIIGMNKILTNQLITSCNLLTPETSIYKHGSSDFIQAKNFLHKYKKVIIKPIKSGSSLGVSYATNECELAIGIQKAITVEEENTQDAIIQKYIQGEEFTVIAIQKANQWEIFVPTEIEKNDYIYTYEKKYLPGATQKHTPARFSEATLTEIHTGVQTIINALDPHDIIRIDGIRETDSGNIFFLDINTIPGTAPSSYVFLQSAYAGYHNSEIIHNLIENSISRFIKQTQSLAIKNKFLAHRLSIQEKSNKKIQIAIFLGGNTNEREISLESGRNVFYKLSSSFFNKKAIFVSSERLFYELSLYQLTKDTTEAIEADLQPEQLRSLEEIQQSCDFIFIALHGGYGENGTLQADLECYKIPYNGSSSAASATGMNKYLTAQKLSQHGLHTPEQLLIDKYDRDHVYEKKVIEYLLWKYKKIIIKPHDDGCSAYIDSADSYEKTIDTIEQFWQSSNKLHCLIEGAICGIEITVGCIGNRPEIAALPITETIKHDTVLSLEEKFLPGCGTNITPAKFTNQVGITIAEEIKRAYSILACDGYARIDCFWLPEAEKLVFLECNTLPALTPATCLFHQAAEINLSPEELLSYIIYLGFKKHNPAFMQNEYEFFDYINTIKDRLATETT
jgi:UDP-N-acetylmuramate--alanine ligase